MLSVDGVKWWVSISIIGHYHHLPLRSINRRHSAVLNKSTGFFFPSFCFFLFYPGKGSRPTKNGSTTHFWLVAHQLKITALKHQQLIYLFKFLLSSWVWEGNTFASHHVLLRLLWQLRLLLCWHFVSSGSCYVILFEWVLLKFRWSCCTSCLLSTVQHPFYVAFKR